ncbi:uncharacterized protein SAPINGB_P001227 [Magnusiomyces paraingens]|uniref:Inorganic pyrophosphatase n=1 Tax=Magnusiomyces paraingens TaxID=2606893 RepID=A0A5E8B580_9ASCO|nr:uncharacterized protein SAPINGB_P001227 [Saprochaete ingens]VVT46465.1 unnamed protein product [Saprochaete ingens]
MSRLHARLLHFAQTTIQPSLTSQIRTMSSYTSVHVGKPDTLDYKVYIRDASGKVISSVHDIPLKPEGVTDKHVFNMVVEVPRWSNAKLEMSSKFPFNPIVQDTKKGKLRYVRNLFPYKGYIHNYGAIPQTWEDPTFVDPNTSCNGDGDPIDVCEIGEQVGYIGQVKQVKVLGLVALIDEGETDWKVLAIDVTDPLAEKLNNLADVEEHLPGLIAATRHWFRDYKRPDGKPSNEFAFNGEAKEADFSLEVIEHCHKAWKEGLLTGTNPKANYDNTNSTLEGSKGFNPAEADKLATDGVVYTHSEPVGDDKWYYYKN